MIVKGPVVTEIGKLILEAQNRVIEGIKEGTIETEPSMTDRFLENVQNVFDEYSKKGSTLRMRFRARTLRDRGKNAPEEKYGADFCGVLDIQLRGFKQTKGFLSQSKKEKDGIKTRHGYYGLTGVKFSINDEFRRLVGQIDNMLLITPDSFVFIYSNDGFLVVPATSIGVLKLEAELYAKPVDQFFKEFVMCFVGDHLLNAWDDNTLEQLRIKTHSRSAFLFQINEMD